MRRFSFFWKFYLLAATVVFITCLSLFYLRPSLPGYLIFAGGLISLVVAAPVAYLFSSAITESISEIEKFLTQSEGQNEDGGHSFMRRDELGTLGTQVIETFTNLRNEVRSIGRERDELTAMLDEFGQGVIAVNENEEITYINRVATDLLDTERSESIGRPIYEIARNDEISEAVSQSLSEHKPVQREVTRVQPQEEQILEITTSLLKNDQDKAQGLVISLNDVTELRRLQTVRQDFVANVSHELKTPLTAIQGLIDTLLDNGSMDTQTRNRFMNKIRNQINRMTELTHDLLTISRLESADDNLSFNKIDLRTPVKEAFKNHEPVAREKNHELNLEIPDEAVYMEGDASAIQQLVANLLDNAIKYTPTEGSISIRIPEVDPPVLEVDDNGIGIEPRKQERIFERFYRVDEGRSREEGGTGLGLSIVKHVALSHGGSISLDSTPGRGTTFRIEFPTYTEDSTVDNSEK